MEIKQGRGFSDIQGTDDPTGCFNINQVLLWEKDFDRNNLYFPQMLFNLGLTGHKEERLLLKIEAQNQEVLYQSDVAYVNKKGFFFGIPVPPPDVLCAMKFSAILDGSKAGITTIPSSFSPRQNPIWIS